MELKFYICEHCGNLITHLKRTGVPIMCCGQEMTELIPGSTDGALEKHVPVVEKSGDEVLVKIGEIEHPMLEKHYIEWIALQTKDGVQVKYLHPGDRPRAVFLVSGEDKAVAAYEYCNLHGLWKKEI